MNRQTIYIYIHVYTNVYFYLINNIGYIYRYNWKRLCLWICSYPNKNGKLA